MPVPAARPLLSEPSTPPFLLSIDLAEGRVSVHGELDREQVPRLLEAVGALRFSPAPYWVVDASAVTFCDAAGLGGLATARGLAHQSDRTLRIEGTTALLRRLMNVIGLPAG